MAAIAPTRKFNSSICCQFSLCRVQNTTKHLSYWMSDNIVTFVNFLYQFHRYTSQVKTIFRHKIFFTAVSTGEKLTVGWVCVILNRWVKSTKNERKPNWNIEKRGENETNKQKTTSTLLWISFTLFLSSTLRVILYDITCSETATSCCMMNATLFFMHSNGLCGTYKYLNILILRGNSPAHAMIVFSFSISYESDDQADVCHWTKLRSKVTKSHSKISENLLYCSFAQCACLFYSFHFM